MFSISLAMSPWRFFLKNKWYFECLNKTWPPSFQPQNDPSEGISHDYIFYQKGNILFYGVYNIFFFFTESNKQQNKLDTCSSAMGPIFHFLLQETKSKLKISGHRWIIQTLKNVQENNMILALSRKYILLEQSRLKRKEFLILIGVVGIIIHITWNIYEHFLLSPWGNKQFRLIWNFSKVSWDSHTTHTP